MRISQISSLTLKISRLFISLASFSSSITQLLEVIKDLRCPNLLMKYSRKRGKDSSRKKNNRRIHHPSTAIHHTRRTANVIPIVNDKKITVSRKSIRPPVATSSAISRARRQKAVEAKKRN